MGAMHLVKPSGIWLCLLHGGIVVLPFYVMLMTSLKSQQALLMNPLDLMPNWRQEGWAIFRSYIELFRDFNFGRYIGVSAIVSLATVALTLLFAIPRLRCRSLALRRRKVLSAQSC